MNNAEGICGVTPDAVRIKTTLTGRVIYIVSVGSFKNGKYWDAKNVLKQFEEVFGGGMYVYTRYRHKLRFFLLAEPNRYHLQTRTYTFIPPRFQRFEKAQSVAV